MMAANAKLAESMGVAGKSMAEMNKILKPEQVAANINAFSRESMKMSMTDEMSEFCEIFLTFSMIFNSIIFESQ